MTKSLINWMKLVLEQYPEEKCSVLQLLGNRLRTVANLGAIYSELKQLKRDMEGGQKSLGTISFKKPFCALFRITKKKKKTSNFY